VKPVRFADTVEQSLEKDYPEGLQDQRQFELIFIDTQIVTPEILKTIHKLQPQAKVGY
jgi:hypothetical protein